MSDGQNSWGSGWGEKGYIRVKRGVSMCGIGGTIVHVKCANIYSTHIYFISTLYLHISTLSLHISTGVGTDLHGEPACPGPHVSLQQGLVRALVTAGSAGQRVPEQPGISIIIIIIASNEYPHKGS